MIINLNLFFETILVLFAIFISNGIIYSLIFFNLNDKNYSENISLIRNNSAKDGLVLKSLIASNPINLTSSESSTSDTLSLTSSNSSTSDTGSGSLLESSISENLSLTSIDSNGSNDINNIGNLMDEPIIENLMDEQLIGNLMEVPILGNLLDEEFTSLDSLTILNTETFEQWRSFAMSLQEFPHNTPLGILQTIKFQELKILYSQDLIEYSVTHTELRLIIEHFPAISLFAPDINHLILTIMSFYHF
uniref:hypothetical protein n=1 Tax=Russula emetica TaxID=152958 RepID=UPI0031F3B5BF